MFRFTGSARRGSPLLVLVVATSLAAPALSDEGDSARRSREYARVPAAAVDTTSRPAQIEPSSSPPEERLPVYRPPRRGAPRAKVGGGLRGARALPTPQALAPAHLAQTITAQPSLFWYIDAVPNESSELVFTLIDEEGIDPVAEVALISPKQAGVQRIRLADHGVSLAPGTEYEWSIALVVDPEHRAKDVVSTGYIRRVSQPAELELRPPCVTTYADLGLWYDALESVSDSIDAVPGDVALLGQRASLLSQVGLGAVIE
jgi:hypothetical protein